MKPDYEGEENSLSFATEEWMSIPRHSRTIPFGYVVSDDDPDVLDPVPHELEALKKCKEYKKDYTYKDLAEWVSAATGRYISSEGLRKRLNNEKTRQRTAIALERWAKRYAEKAEKAIKFREAYPGAKETKPITSEGQYEFDFGDAYR